MQQRTKVMTTLWRSDTQVNGIGRYQKRISKSEIGYTYGETIGLIIHAALNRWARLSVTDHRGAYTMYHVMDGLSCTKAFSVNLSLPEVHKNVDGVVLVMFINHFIETGRFVGEISRDLRM